MVARCTVARLLQRMGLRGVVRGQVGADHAAAIRPPLARSTG